MKKYSLTLLLIYSIYSFAQPAYTATTKAQKIQEAIEQQVYNLSYSKDSHVQKNAMNFLLDNPKKAEKPLLKALLNQELTDITLKNILNILIFIDPKLSTLNEKLITEIFMVQKEKPSLIREIIIATYGRFNQMFNPIIKQLILSESPTEFTHGFFIVYALKAHSLDETFINLIEANLTPIKHELLLTLLYDIPLSKAQLLSTLPSLEHYSPKIRYRAILLLSKYPDLELDLQKSFSKGSPSQIFKESIINIMAHYNNRSSLQFILEEMEDNKSFIVSGTQVLSGKKLTKDQYSILLKLFKNNQLFTIQKAILVLLEANIKMMNKSSKNLVLKALTKYLKNNEESDIGSINKNVNSLILKIKI